MTRRTSRRTLAKRILMVAEGKQTEPQYVERLVAYLRSSDTTTAVKTVGVGKDPLRVVQKCIELRNVAEDKGKPYDESVCLVDVDRHSTLEQALDLATKESIIVIVSNLKFEVWLRWHAETSRSQLSSDQLDSVVSKHNLLTGKAISPHFPMQEVVQACTVAYQADPDLAGGRVGPNPSSAMPLLVNLIGGEMKNRQARS